jgi:signal transduction histidine kinase
VRREGDTDTLSRLVTALAHEVRNPLVSIRTFSELLPESYDDEDFRVRFQELVGQDVRRIEEVIARLQSLIELPEAQRQPVDVAALLDALLDERREEIQARRLLVLKELDRSQPFALGDRDQLRAAFAGLLGKALALVPERGDVYLASKHHGSGLHGEPTVRVLLRYHNPDQPRSEIVDHEGAGIRPGGISVEETALEFVIAEAIIRAQGGALTVDNTDAQETVIVVDLPAPPSGA